MSRERQDPGKLSLGLQRDQDGQNVELPLAGLLRHMMALGSSGSGKTVLSKVVVEEVARQGIPAICVDPQGDLCSLVEAVDEKRWEELGIDPAKAKSYREQVDVVIFTPASHKGVALCADPVEQGLAGLAETEQVQAISRTAARIVSLLGYDLDGDEGAGLCAVFDAALTSLAGQGRLHGLGSLTEHLTDLDDETWGRYERLIDRKRLQTACRRLARLDVGARRLLFHQGVPLDIDVLLGRGDHGTEPGKTRISIVYLNTLHHQEDKDFFVAALADRLYSWMLEHPSEQLQALFYIDEVAPFVPPVRKPACKDSLQLLFKQARKYGLGCLMATQNPGDVDYKAMAQFGTWALGRLTTRQDLKKVEPTVKALDPVGTTEVMGALPGLKPGQFLLLSPDHLARATPLQTRWLLTEHATYDEERIQDKADKLWRKRFASLDRAATPPPPGATDTSGSEQAAAVNGEADRVTPIPPTLDESSTAAEAAAAAVPPRRPAVEEVVSVPAAAPVPEAEAPRSVADGKLVAEGESQERWARLLARRQTMSTSQFAQAGGMGENKARRVLKDLVGTDVARQFKDGRTLRYWATARGSRPDLGLDDPVLCIAQGIPEAEVRRIALERRRSKLLGLLGDEEDLATVQLVYRSVYKLDFEEKIERSLLRRLVGPKHDQRIGSVYVHPHRLGILVFTPQEGVVFADRPAEHASEVEDFDGQVTFHGARPMDLPIDEDDWAGRKSVKDVTSHFGTRFAASPGTVTPVFVPLWTVTYASRGGAGYRREMVDGIIGKPTSWPERAC